MSDIDLRQGCPVCKHRQMVTVESALTFHQMTDKGRVTCHVTLPMSVCSHCRFEMLDAGAEATMNHAVDQEYSKLRHGTGTNGRDALRERRRGRARSWGNDDRVRGPRPECHE